MNKPLIITSAFGVLLLAIGSWLYLFLFGAPQSPDEVFTDLGITPPTGETLPPTAIDDGSAVVDVTSGPLQQLTLRPVAGYVISATNTVVYVEQGTGHFFQINTATGEEGRVTNTSLPVVTHATLNETGTAAAFVSGLPGERVTFIGRRLGDTIEQISLPPMAENFTFTSTSTVLYTVANAEGSRAFSYDLNTNQQREVFTTPFRDIRVHVTADATYVSNRPAAALEGSVYEVNGTSLTPISNPRFGLTVLMEENWYAQTYVAENTIRNEIVNRQSGEVTPVAPIMLPEKCVWHATDLICASPIGATAHTFIDDWYKGVAQANDRLWRIDPDSGGATQLMNPETILQRPIDMNQVLVTDDQIVYFKNRTDNTLWRYVETATQ